MAHQFSRISISQWAPTGKLETIEMYSLSVLEAGSRKLRSWQDWFFLETLRKKPSHPSLLASGGRWILGILWPVEASLQSLLHLPIAFFSASLCVFPALRMTLPVDLGPTLIQQVDHCHPYFNYFCKHAISRAATFSDSGQVGIGGGGRDTIQPTTQGELLGERDHVLSLPLWHPMHAKHV